MRIVSLLLVTLACVISAHAQANATNVPAPNVTAPAQTPPAAQITIVTPPTQCELRHRRVMEQDWGPYQKMIRECEYFSRTGLKAHCTSECAYRARVFADLVAANAGLRACVMADPKARNLVNMFAEKGCGSRSPSLQGADVVYDSEGNPLSFRGFPEPELELGLSFVHPNNHPQPDTTPVVRRPLAITQAHANDQTAQSRNAPQLRNTTLPANGTVTNNGTTNSTLSRSNATNSTNSTAPKFRQLNADPAVNSTVVRRQQAAEKVNRTEDPNTWNWEGKPVRHVNHTLTGKPLNPRQIELISPINNGRPFFLPGAVSNTAYGRNQTALTREEVAICVGPFGPLQRVRSGCADFLKRLPSPLLFPLERFVNSTANVSSTPTAAEIKAIRQHIKKMEPVLANISSCPSDCVASLLFFRTVIDSAFHVSKCLSLKTYAHTFTALRGTVCDPLRLGFVAGGSFNAMEDPLTAVNPSTLKQMPEKITCRSYVGRLSMPPPRMPERPSTRGLNAARVPGLNTSAPVRLGGGHVGASREAPKAGENNATQVSVVEAVRHLKGWNGLEPSEDYGMPDPESDAYARAGFCKGEGVSFEIGPDGKPRYCKPRPDKIRLDRGGKVVYEKDAGPRINYDAFLRVDKNGKPVYPRPLKTNARRRKIPYQRASDYVRLPRVLPRPEFRPHQDVDSVLVNITQYGRGVNANTPVQSSDELMQKLALAADHPQTMEDSDFQQLIRDILNAHSSQVNGTGVIQVNSSLNVNSSSSAANSSGSGVKAPASMNTLLRALTTAEQFETAYPSNNLEQDRIEFAPNLAASSRYMHEKRFQAVNSTNATSNATVAPSNATAANVTHVIQLVNVSINPSNVTVPEVPYAPRNLSIEEITVRKQVRNLARPTPKADNATDVLLAPEDEERFKAYFAQKLATLATAGYTDEKRNVRLLIKHHGDINKVLAVLTGQSRYGDLSDRDDAPSPLPTFNVTRKINLTVPESMANMTLPELLSRPAEPVVNTTNSTVPSPAVVPVNITRLITTAIKVNGEDLKRAGVPYYFTAEKPVDIFDEAFSNGSN